MGLALEKGDVTLSGGWIDEIGCLFFRFALDPDVLM